MGFCSGTHRLALLDDQFLCLKLRKPARRASDLLMQVDCLIDDLGVAFLANCQLSKAHSLVNFELRHYPVAGPM